MDTQRVLNVTVPTVKRLMVRCFPDDFSESELDDSKSIDESDKAGCKLVVDGPNIEELHLHDYLSEDFSLKNLSSLLKTFVCVNCPRPIRFNCYGDPIYKLLSGITNVKSLTLYDLNLLSLSNGNDFVLPTFHNLTCLKFPGWNLLTDFLECSPNLEFLIIEKEYNSANSWSSPQRVPNCLLLHLKEIKIEELYGLEYELEAVEYLLKNAKVLKKMTIDC